MLNAVTQKPLSFFSYGTPSRYFQLPLDQVPEVRDLLDRHHVRFWVAEQAYSVDDGPYMTRIHLSQNDDIEATQAILDSVP